MRVLIVTQDATCRSQTKERLVDAWPHCSIEDASDCVTAMKIVNSAPPDLVISDLQMPCMSVVEFFRFFHTSHPDTPVGLLTGETSVIEREQLLRKGATFVIKKPVTSEELDKALSLLPGACA